MIAPFAGRTAIVTGGAQGIGEAIAGRLVRGGALVTIADIDPSRAEETASRVGAVASKRCDVTVASEVNSLVDGVVERFGRLDAMITSAGITRDDLIHRLSGNDWRAVIETHLTGSFLCAQAAQRPMVSAGSGRIVFLSSGAARGNRGQANYSAAKAGIEGLTRTLALELGRFAITVNAVAPGFIDTRMARAAAERRGQSWDEFRATVERGIALGRIGQPADVADVVAFLCSDDARYLTGQILQVRGGP